MAKVRFERDGERRERHARRPAAQPVRPRDDRRSARARSTRRRRRTIRALVVRAEGEVFTGGADVNMFVGLTGEQVERELDLIAIPRKLEASPSPPWRSCTACA